LSIADLHTAFVVNTDSALVAARQAVLGFATLPQSASKTFIYTGNGLNIEPIGPLLGGGMSKSASAHFIHSASKAYRDRGYKYIYSQDTVSRTVLMSRRFYYADERKADGSVAGQKVDGPAHGEFYFQLSEDVEQGPWDATFVKDKGYQRFDHSSANL
jgi:hypothetical protein